MSRIGKQIIAIPEKVEVTLATDLLGTTVTVKGPLGTNSRHFKKLITIEKSDTGLTLTPAREGNFEQALWGTYASHLWNMINGVVNGYTKKLILEGVGYKADVSGKDLVMALGFSHPVRLPVPEGIKVVSEKGTLTISGHDKEVLGQFAATIYRMKPPEPYKGKGFHFEGEVIRRKQGKKSTAA